MCDAAVVVELDSPPTARFRSESGPQRRVRCRRCDRSFRHPSHRYCSRRCLRLDRSPQRPGGKLRRRRVVLIATFVAPPGAFEASLGVP